jgi:DnaJ-class molecular chaperone
MSKKIVKRTPCPFCNDGVLSEIEGSGECPHCLGVGEQGSSVLSYGCVACETTGKVGGVICEDCSGNGYVPLDFSVIEDLFDKVKDVFELAGEIKVVVDEIKAAQ